MDTGVPFENYPVVNQGEYVGRCIDIKAMLGGKFGDSYLFSFELEDESCRGIRVSGMAQKVLHPGNKLHRWFTGLGAILKMGEVFNPSTLIGARARVYVDLTNKDGIQRNRVKEINPLQRVLPPGVRAQAQQVMQPQPAPVYVAPPQPQQVVQPSPTQGQNVTWTPPTQTQIPVQQTQVPGFTPPTPGKIDF